MTQDVYELRRGDAPLLISAPHVGTELPEAIAARLTAVGRTLIDADWHVDRLYAFAAELGATMLRARYSRYVIDVNRDPGGVSLYPGARTTSLCPTETFEGEPLYAHGDAPDDAEIAARRERYWQPYHDVLAAEIARLRALHEHVVVLDAHSIWGRLPLLFEGELPDVNLGTDSGRSCEPALREAVVEVLRGSPYGHVVDGRFKGGYITRHYADPAHGVQTLQIELNQRTYLADGSRSAWDDAKAARLSVTLRAVCDALLVSAPA